MLNWPRFSCRGLFYNLLLYYLQYSLIIKMKRSKEDPTDIRERVFCEIYCWENNKISRVSEYKKILIHALLWNLLLAIETWTFWVQIILSIIMHCCREILDGKQTFCRNAVVWKINNFKRIHWSWLQIEWRVEHASVRYLIIIAVHHYLL